jgi:hypothetical protein
MFVAVSLPRTLSRFEPALGLPLGLTEATSINFDGCAHAPLSDARAIAPMVVKRANCENLMSMPMRVVTGVREKGYEECGRREP